MVEQYPHVMAERSHNEALSGVAQHKLDLFASHSGEPFQEIVDPGSAFKVFEQGAHGYAAMLE